MKLATFRKHGISRVGAVVGEEIVDSLNAEGIPSTMREFLAAGVPAMQRLTNLVEKSTGRIALADVSLEAPIPNPSKYLAISLNYGEHIAETGRDRPEYPSFFNKQVSCVIGPGEPIHRPRVSEKLDYEGELAIVIGTRCRHVPRQEAAKVIAGFMVANDVSVRDWQIRSPTFTLGKSFDTHGPIGPWIVTPDEIDDPHRLRVETRLNDEPRQSFNTAEMIFNCYEQIEYLSTVMTLEPGDILSTGTGSGVGVRMKPRGYMKPGDLVRVEIEGIGTLSNPVIDEPEDTVHY
ncbi:MAG: fumarylacetoacetate hydrolase family protein [Methylococcaceae bacterium]|nr:fumarylacetoacetate hydrolase family protein [Methylococcaceae bacterium]MCI0667917.1 fumarylacetoacetate hydrolase family protein [Methylococcaceae bacterium]MCI0734004.1 fumarylacetoacetate hydrolase family protein [Methylococcaceae bacterium]